MCEYRFERLTRDQTTGVGSLDCLKNSDFVFVDIEIGHYSGKIGRFGLVLQDPVLAGRAFQLVLVKDGLGGDPLRHISTESA